jgi:hypothetical protein
MSVKCGIFLNFKIVCSTTKKPIDDKEENRSKGGRESRQIPTTTTTTTKKPDDDDDKDEEDRSKVGHKVSRSAVDRDDVLKTTTTKRPIHLGEKDKSRPGVLATPSYSDDHLGLEATKQGPSPWVPS